MKKKEEQETAKTKDKTQKKRNKCASKDNKSEGVAKNKSTSKSRAKPKAKRKTRSDGLTQALKIAQSVHRDITPPSEIRFTESRHYEFFDRVINELAKSDWTDHMIDIAALLARTMTDLETEQYMMRKEGGILKRKEVVKGGKTAAGKVKADKIIVAGTYVNPRKSLIDMHTKNILQFRRSLSLHSRAIEGEGREAGKRRAAAKQLEGKMQDEDDEDALFARPTIQ